MALTDNLVSYWKLDEASGTAFDAHGSNDLTDNNTVTSAAGKINTARQFTAANDESLSHVTNSDLETGNIDYTIAVWTYFDDLVPPQTLMAKYGDAGDNEYALYFSGGGEAVGFFAFEITDGSESPTLVQASTFGPPSANTWYYVLAWHDAAANTINIQVNNGAVDSESHTTGGGVTDSPFRLGALGDTPALCHDGYLDEAAFWKRILTSDERTSLYGGGDGNAYPFTVSTPVGFFSLLAFWLGGGGTDGSVPLIQYGTLKPIWHGRGRRR